MKDDRDTAWMRLALQLAAKARGQTAPNPMVGAVVVRRGRVVGYGYHRRAGRPHAEVIALRRAGLRTRGATLYVTLEPCQHQGRTPPCCPTVVNAGIRRVVIAARDPNPLTNGRGVRLLQRAGIQVRVGVLAAEARRLNEPFETVMRRSIPLVIGKIAQSLDGKIATVSGESRWITSAAARHQAHQLRRRVDAILVGVQTILQDDPLLSARGVGGQAHRPLKVIVDSRLRTPPTARCLSAASSAPTIIATVAAAGAGRSALERRGAEIWVFRRKAGQSGVPLAPLCQQLAQRGVQQLLIEGGGEVLASAFAQRLVGRVVWWISPILLGGRRAPTSVSGAGWPRLATAPRIYDMTVTRVGRDLRIEGRVMYST